MNYTTLFESMKEKALRRTPDDIDSIMKSLNEGDLPLSRAVDFYLGFVTNQDGISRLSHYLFEGTLIQRNDSALFFENKTGQSRPLPCHY